MNLLIVDDEYYTVENIRMKLEKKRPIFAHIFCAYNMKQALAYFAENEIAIMICDIEMPGGSGLELLDHIRQRQLKTICIFLTAYAKFDYISKAMKLSSMDYLLKPVDETQLLSSVDKAISQFYQQKDAQINTLHAGYWRDSELYLIELFWQELLEGSISCDTSHIQSELRYRNLDPEIAEMEYLFVLIQCNQSSNSAIDSGLFEFILKNIVREYFYSDDELPVTVRLTGQLYLLPLPALSRSQPKAVERCMEALRDFVPHFPNTFNFYVAPASCHMSDFASIFSVIRKASRENVSLENHVFDLTRPLISNYDMPGRPFPSKRWADLLLQKKVDILHTEALTYLNQLQHSGSATSKSLTVFYYSFLQMLFSDVENNHSDALIQFKEHILQSPADQICSSFSALRSWMNEILTQYAEVLVNAGNQDSAISTVKAYIHAHLHEELSREYLASMVYLNPDYLSHMFKKETGLSLTNYIINERIQKSKRLLSRGDMSIRDIAITCGFQNISYFSKQFKKSTGMTPREFRK